MLGFALYNYAYYLLGAALNVFFPLYLALVVTSGATLGLAASRIVVPLNVASSFGAKTPARFIGGYFVFVGVSLACVWLALWAAYAFHGRPTPVQTEAFKIVAALDSVLMVPALITGGILLGRRHPWGFIGSAIAGIQASLYLLVLSVTSSVAVSRGLAEWPGEVPIWGGLAITTSAITLLLLVSVDRKET